MTAGAVDGAVAGAMAGAVPGGARGVPPDGSVLASGAPPFPPVLPWRARAFGDRVAVTDATGSTSHAALLAWSEAVARRLLREAGAVGESVAVREARESGVVRDGDRGAAAQEPSAGAPGALRDLAEARVAILVTPGAAWVAATWGAWLAGGIAVPLSPQHPPAEWAYVLADADVALVLADADHAAAIAQVAADRAVPVVHVGEPGVGDGAGAGAGAGLEGDALPELSPDRRALILYTSGTTGKPKGVVHTHASLAAQVDALLMAWGWRADDHALLVLPLHHVHGIVNVVCCALACGARLTMHARFDAGSAWEALVEGGVTTLHAVPTIWARLLAEHYAAPPGRRAAMQGAVRAMRLLVSGSAALPVSVLERWRALSGQALLERYGMTEIGMALSNPLDGVRVPGHVGLPLPGVAVRAVGEDGAEVPAGTPGELEVRGATVMREYWRRPAETAAAFHDGWFRTGDVGVFEATDGGPSWRLLGRRSTDIIKTGGYKVSALEVEEALRAHPAVAECAVVGVADAEWGERVAAAVELAPGASLTLEALRGFLKPRLAAYKVPTALAMPVALPRNAMGKVVKPAVRELFGASKRSGSTAPDQRL
jgi:malonyl-CoA/methylmalonyl-CoA synthetase